MKKILIVNGSKRRNGNSYKLEARIAEQLQGKAEVTTFNIGEKDVRACLACDGCKRQHTPNCVQRDDFTVISQILCKHRFRCKTEQNIFKAGAAEAVSALSTK